MCRSIKQLRSAQQPPSDEEIEAAALQFVRKVSGYRRPSRANRPGFDTAVAEIAAATRRLLEEIGAQEGAALPGPTSAAQHDTPYAAGTGAASRSGPGGA
jgi:hypothetical protein